MLLDLIVCLLPRIAFGTENCSSTIKETPPIDGSSLSCFHVLHGNVFRVISPSWFDASGHHLSPRVVRGFSPRSSVPTSSMSRSSLCLDLTRPVPPLHIAHCLPMSALISTTLPHGHICESTSPSSRSVVYLFNLFGRSRSPTRNGSLRLFVRGAVRSFFHSSSIA